jgi:hypothetical protein
LPPQFVFELPGAHWFALVQQPRQLPGAHLSWHARFWQICPPAEQSLHAAPPFPQSLSCVPVTHTLPSQQPFLHVAGPHAGSAHAPP